MRRYRLAAVFLAVLPALLAVPGCGDDDEDVGRPGTATERAKVEVGVIPIADVAPLYLGVERGFFEEEQLDVTPRPAQAGAAIVASVVSGDLQIGFSNVVSLILAQDRGLPVRIVAQGIQATDDPTRDYSAVLVKGDSTIREPKGLEGKTIAINALSNIGDVTIKAAFEKKGVDVSKLKFIELPFPDMNAALQQGRVDAIWVVEPFATAAKASGARVISQPYAETAPELTVATYFTTQRYLDENRPVVDRFVRAMNKSLQFAQQNPDAVRRIVPTYTNISPEAANAMVLGFWRPDLNRPSIELLGRLMVKYGLATKEPDLDALIARP